MRHSLAALALAGVMLSSFTTSAQESATPPESDAAALFREAEARYVAGDVAGALESMQRSYDLSGRAELLFNLGELRRELGKCVEARRDYEAYLERVDTGSRRERALAALDALRAECPEPETAILPPPASPPAAPAPAPVAEPISTTPAMVHGPSTILADSKGVRPMTIAGWSAIGAGVLAGVGAIYFAVRAGDHESRLESRIKSLQANPNGEGFSDQDKDLEVDGERAAMWARVLGIGAAGFATVGVTLLLFGADAPETNRASVSIEWRGDGSTAAYRHSF